MTVVVTALGAIVVALISGAVTIYGVVAYRRLRDSQADSETVGQMKIIVDERNAEVDRLKDTLAVYELRQRDHETRIVEGERRLRALERWASRLAQQVIDLGGKPVPFVIEE